MMQTNAKWKYRRRLAYACTCGALLFPLILLKTTEPVVGVVAASFYLFCGSVVGAYIGFSTYHDKWDKD